MSFVPLTGPATLHAADPPRDGVGRVHRRPAGTGRSPCRSGPRCRCWPRPATRGPPTPSVTLLAAASLLAMRLRRRRQVRAAATACWRLAPLDADDAERLQRLAESRAYDGLAADAAEPSYAGVVDAVVDTMPRSAPTGPARRQRRPARRPAAVARRGRRADFTAGSRRWSPATAAARRPAPAGRPSPCGSRPTRRSWSPAPVRLVLQVHDEQNPLHVCDAALLWTEPGPVAEPRVRRPGAHPRHASRCAAPPRPGRCSTGCSSCRVPDEITLDTDELVSLLEDGVGGPPASGGVDVLWPRSLGRDLTRDRRARPGARRAPRGPARRGRARPATPCSPSTGRSRCTATR